MERGVVEKIVEGGWGIVRHPEGTVFLNQTIPGEEVSYKIREKAKGILWGDLVKIHKSTSRHRVEPACPYFPICGGCTFLHMDYAYQLEIKRQILKENLEKFADITMDIPRLVPSRPFQYRIRAKMKSTKKGQIGFIKKSTHSVIPIRHCLLFPYEINQYLSVWNEKIDDVFVYQQDIMLDPDSKRLYVHLPHPPDQKAELKMLAFPDVTFTWPGEEDRSIFSLSIEDSKYLASPAAFFQVNRFMWEPMRHAVKKYLKKMSISIDLYSGVGFFIPLLLENSFSVMAVENHPLASRLAGQSFPESRIIPVAAEKFSFPETDLILVDPPRPGLSKKVMGKILNRKYPKIIYVSCSSVSFARDLKKMTDSGYVLKDLQILDLFPNTTHFETIALLES